MSKFSLSAFVIAVSCLQGCSTLHTTAKATPLDKNAQWVLLPSINNTETPQAGARLDSITASLLRVNGVSQVNVYSTNTTNDSLFDVADRRHQEQALNAVKSSGAKYAVAASVDEWRYKVGLDGEPAAGVTVNIIDLSTGQVVWSGTAAKTGWSREAVSAIAQKTVDQLLKNALNR